MTIIRRTYISQLVKLKRVRVHDRCTKYAIQSQADSIHSVTIQADSKYIQNCTGDFKSSVLSLQLIECTFKSHPHPSITKLLMMYRHILQLYRCTQHATTPQDILMSWLTLCPPAVGYRPFTVGYNKPL